METRKYQLQQQILEALKANDNDLYSLLKSQWAHRFGVESLEELKNLDLGQLNQKPTYLNNQKKDQSQEDSEDSFEANKAILIKGADNQEKGIQPNELESQNKNIDVSPRIKSYEFVRKENVDSKDQTSLKDKKNSQEIDVLIPLPPQTRYGYLQKWLLRK